MAITPFTWKAEDYQRATVGINRPKVLELATSMHTARNDLAGVTGALQNGLETDRVFLGDKPLADIANIWTVKTTDNIGIVHDSEEPTQQAFLLTGQWIICHQN